ncbi:hypothetical protein FKM82_029659 [Ascaphus truei]
MEGPNSVILVGQAVIAHLELSPMSSRVTGAGHQPHLQLYQPLLEFIAWISLGRSPERFDSSLSNYTSLSMEGRFSGKVRLFPPSGYKSLSMEGRSPGKVRLFPPSGYKRVSQWTEGLWKAQTLQPLVTQVSPWREGLWKGSTLPPSGYKSLSMEGRSLEGSDSSTSGYKSLSSRGGGELG